MESKERVLTLASAARRAGIDPEELRQLIDGGTLDVVETEGGNILIGENALKGIIKDIQTVEASKPNMTVQILEVLYLMKSKVFWPKLQVLLRDRKMNY